MLLKTLPDKTGKTRGVMFREAIRACEARKDSLHAQRRLAEFGKCFMETGETPNGFSKEEKAYERAQDRLMRDPGLAMQAAPITAQGTTLTAEEIERFGFVACKESRERFEKTMRVKGLKLIEYTMGIGIALATASVAISREIHSRWPIISAVVVMGAAMIVGLSMLLSTIPIHQKTMRLIGARINGEV